MLRKDVYPYVIRSTTNAAIGAGAIAFTAFVGYSAFRMGSAMLADTTHNATPEKLAELSQEMESLSKPKNIRHCQNEVSEYQTTGKSEYITCLKGEITDPTIIPFIGFGVIALGFGLSYLWKAAAYAKLAMNVVHNNLVKRYTLPKSDVVIAPVRNSISIEELAEEHRILSEKSFVLMNGVNPFAKIILAEGDEIFTESGSLIAKGNDISMTTMFKGSARRAIAGESMTLVKFANPSKEEQFLLLTPRSDGEMLEIPLDQGERIICENKAFFASKNEVDVSWVWTGDLSMRVLSGMGNTQQTVTAKDKPAKVLLASEGQITREELREGKTMHVQGSAVLAMSDTVSIKLEPVRSFFSRVAGGEGAFLLELTGPGTVWLTSKGRNVEKGGIAGALSQIRSIVTPG